MEPQAAQVGAHALAAFGSKVRITNLKTFGVTIPGAPPDRPYVFVKLETNEGVAGWEKVLWRAKPARCWHASTISRSF